MKHNTSTVKVGLLTIISLSLLIFVLIWLRGRGITGGVEHTVLFKDVDGMREGAPVQLMGIRVGFVDKVEPLVRSGRYYVKVRFTINDQSGIEIPRGSKISIEQSGIIGEKFLEITPPQLREVTLTTFREPAKGVEAGIPVKFLYESGYLSVGTVEDVKKEMDANLVRLKLYYRVTTPGAVMPEDPLFELTMDDNQQYFLRILSQKPVLAEAPDPNLTFTIENPLRIKEFLAIQMESAEALRLTNEKITQLLSDDTIDTLNSTLKNTEVLTARATEVLDSANHLFQTTGKDIEQLVAASKTLTANVSEVSENLNAVIGNPQVKQDLTATIAALNQSTTALNEILQDPNLKETLALTKETSQNASELLGYLKTSAEDIQLRDRLDTSLTLMNVSLAKLTNVLTEVEKVTNDKDQNLQLILQDTREAMKNVRDLSNTVNTTLNKPFGLMRLLF